MVDGPYPVFGANGVIGWHSQYNHEDRELLLGCRGSVGTLNFSEPRSWITSNAMVVRPRENTVDREFLRYALLDVDLSEAISGVAQPQITRTSLAVITIPIPPLAEQKRIVAILDEAFEGIAKATANAERNSASARELFDAFRSSLLSSADVDFVPLGKVCENLDSRRVPITKRDRNPGAIPYYGASGIVDSVADWIFDEELLLVSEDGANLLMRTYPIAFSVSGKCWVNNHVHVLRFSSRFHQALVEYYLNSISLEPWVSGMAQPKLNQKALNSIPVPSCSDELAATLVGKLDELSAGTNRARAAYDSRLKLCAELRAALLHKAFSGQLTKTPAIAA